MRNRQENPISTDLAFYILWVRRNDYWFFTIIVIQFSWTGRILLQNMEHFKLCHYDINLFLHRRVFFFQGPMAFHRFNMRKCKHVKLTGRGRYLLRDYRTKFCSSVSLGRVSPMKLGGETLVPCFWSVPEQRINFLATMSSAKMNTKLLRKPTRRQSLQWCLIQY